MLTSQVALPSSCLARPGIGSNREVSEHAGLDDQDIYLAQMPGSGCRCQERLVTETAHHALE